MWLTFNTTEFSLLNLYRRIPSIQLIVVSAVGKHAAVELIEIHSSQLAVMQTSSTVNPF
jgi:hypothetical protein